MKQAQVDKIIEALMVRYIKIAQNGDIEDLRAIRIELEDWNNYE